MKPDASFPPPPQFNQPPLPCSDLTPQRQWALDRLAGFAVIAEGLVGSIPEPSAETPPQPYPITSRGFALHCLAASPFVAEVAELLGRSKLNINSEDHVDAPHVMIIDVRKYWGVLGPIRGDIVMFADGQVAIVTKALCMGCMHFEGVSLSIEGVPQIVKQVHWTSTLKWIIRLVDESPLPVPPPAEVPAPDMASADVHAAQNSEAPATPADGAPTGRKTKRTGIG